ncbi:MAG: CpaD family pilus assembly protein [Alphaproteobacteria bacterium]
MTRRPHFGTRPLLIAGAMLAMLAGCADPPENSRLQTYDNARGNHPIELRSRVETTPVTISEKAGITETEQDQLDGFFSDYLAAGGGLLSIVASDKVGGREAAVKRAERVASYAMHRGLLPQELDVRVGPTANDQPVVLSFQRYSLKPQDCSRDAYEPNTTNSRNTLHSRIGCATQANLAAMLANPADLAMRRTETPADLRRSLAIQAYRAGEASDSARSPFANDFRLSNF